MAAETTNLIKQVNLQHLRAALLDLKTATKPQLADHTKLSVITINALIKTLQDSGEVLEDRMIHPNLGRPAMSYKLNETYCMALIVYTFEKNGQDTAFYVVRNLYGDSVENIEKPIYSITPESFDDTIQSFLDSYPSIKMIGFGLPATESGGIIISSDYDSLIGCSFCKERMDKFHRPVFLVNDIKAATVGYCHTHTIKTDQCVIGVYLPQKYAPGVGIYYDGNLMYGRNGLAGRVSTLMPDIDWKTCDYEQAEYQKIAIQIIRMAVSFFNPDIVIVYAESDFEFLKAHWNTYLSSPIEQMMRPKLIVQNNLDHDFRAGITHLALNELFRLRFPIK